MVAGIAAIAIGAVLIAIAPLWADNLGKRFSKAGLQADPAIFKFAAVVAGITIIIFGIVKMTAALR